MDSNNDAHEARRFEAMVEAERQRQESKWGQQNHHPGWWLVILMEEVGELAKAILEKDEANQHEELIQIAAVSRAMHESIERDKRFRAQRIKDDDEALDDAYHGDDGRP